jgi:non-ribosomal peptide synthetase component F
VKGLEHCILRMPSGGDDSAARCGSIAVPLKVTSKLSTFCKQHGLQPDAVFLTAWALVLRSYLGTEDACFGYIVSGGKATQANLEATGSSYPKTLVSSTRMADPESIHSALTAMQSKYSESLHYQGYSDVDIEYGFGSSESRLFNTLVFLNHRLTQGPFQRDGYSAQADRNYEEGKVG